jgi:hypothetical protein
MRAQGNGRTGCQASRRSGVILRPPARLVFAWPSFAPAARCGDLRTAADKCVQVSATTALLHGK